MLECVLVMLQHPLRDNSFHPTVFLYFINKDVDDKMLPGKKKDDLKSNKSKAKGGKIEDRMAIEACAA